MKNLKSALLSATRTVADCTLLGVRVHIRRMSALEAADYDDAIADARAANNALVPARLSARLILSVLVDENGNAIPPKSLPTVDELLAVHDNAALIEAVSVIQRHSYGTLEEAQKN
ncbi:phage tail protein [Escherichia coli]|uniref:phage tail protein n=1 Tax=Escherichia coli TaxID=562 RepID=UPI0038B2C93B